MVGATWLKDEPAFPVTIGNSQTAVSIGYGTCLSGAVHVLSIEYAVSGTTTPDCPYRALPANSKFDIEILSCDDEFLVGNRGTTYVNSDLPCECVAGVPGIPVLAVEPARLDFGPSDVVLTLDIRNDGDGPLEWELFREEPWLQPFPPTGSGDATVTVFVDRGYSGIDEDVTRMEARPKSR
jgi:hypothetical protein